MSTVCKVSLEKFAHPEKERSHLMAQTQQEASGPTTNSSEPLRATDHRAGDLEFRTAPRP